MLTAQCAHCVYMVVLFIGVVVVGNVVGVGSNIRVGVVVV